jgi:PAS domain S-box-containing protein
LTKPPGTNGNREAQLELERQVAARTAELTASNEALRQLREEDRKNQAALQRFRTALDHSADAIFLIDRASLSFIDANQTACDRLGYSREELLQMGPHDIAPYFNKEMVAARLDEIIASPDRSGIIDSFHKRRDGSLYPVEVRLRAIESEGRTLIVANGRDMTVQRQNEEALRQSEEQFRQITENLQPMLWIGEVASERFLYVSPAFESIWGRARALVYKRPRMLLAGIHPGDRERMTAAMQRMWRDEHAMDEEYRLLRQDGGMRWLWTRTFPIRDEKGGVYRIGAVTEDITTRREQEEKLRFSEEKYRQLFERAPIGLGLVGQDRLISEANPALCKMLGYSRDELLTRTNADITYPEDLDSSVENVKQLLSGAISHYVAEKRYVRKDGSLVWGKLHAAVILGRNRQPLFGLGMVENIDQAKRAEEFRQAQDAAQKKALVREVHHRIKNHLQGVVGLLRRQRHEGSPCNAILEETIAQINTVAMVHGLQGKAAGEEIGLVEMVAAISHAVDELISSGHATHIGNALDFPPVISRDESVPLALALNELLVNARKFSTGPVDIALSGERNKVVIRITNPARELPQPIRASGLELVKALLQADGAAFALEHDAERFSAEVCLTPPVLKRS